MKDIAIKTNDVNKSFKLPHEKHSSIKSLVLNGFRGKRTFEKQKALKDITFEIKKGEFFGIVGRNGSGKSTLLKLLAGIYYPDSGGIEVNGNLVPFIELGVGFNPELTGRENVYLNSALLGFSREEVDKKYKEIVEFAELDKFMDQKLKNYSSGMQVRLAFSIAIRAQGDILLLDEVLAVGDIAFQKKCNDYFYTLKKQKQTVILVTHSMGAVEQFCDRAMLIDEGKILKTSDPTEIADLYNEQNLRTSVKSLEEQNKAANARKNLNYKVPNLAKIEKIETFNAKNGRVQDTFTYSEKIGVRYFVRANDKLESPTAGLVFKDRMNNQIFATNTPSMNIKLNNLEKGQKIKVEFEIENIFANGNYFISGGIASKDRAEVYHKVNDIHTFEVGGWKFPESVTHPNHNIKIIY